jgi:hypothetical protein
MKTSSVALIVATPKITIRICALAGGSGPRVECETRVAGVTIGQTNTK